MKTYTKRVTENRQAEVGEKIIVTDPNKSGGEYENGDILTVKISNSDAGVFVEETSRGLYHTEYEVITDEKEIRIVDRVPVAGDKIIVTNPIFDFGLYKKDDIL